MKVLIVLGLLGSFFTLLIDTVTETALTAP